jgi:hypothetical protein
MESRGTAGVDVKTPLPVKPIQEPELIPVTDFSDKSLL